MISVAICQLVSTAVSCTKKFEINLIGKKIFPAGSQGGDRTILTVLTTFFNVLPVSILGCSWVQLVAKRENQFQK